MEFWGSVLILGILLIFSIHFVGGEATGKDRRTVRARVRKGEVFAVVPSERRKFEVEIDLPLAISI